MTTRLEQWRPVVDWEGIYEVSDLGRVRRIRRGPGVRSVGKPLRGTVDQHGYPVVDLCDRGRRKNAKVHRLVADAFLGPLPEGMETRHLNGDPGDARLVNLKYGTHAENMRDMVEHGRSALARTHCPHGHPYNDANTWIDKRGARNCRPCMAARQVAYDREKRAQRRERGEDFWFNVRQWGRENGWQVKATGRIHADLIAAYVAAHRVDLDAIQTRELRAAA